jgi:hypothetical protein
LITGAAGNLGRKLRAGFRARDDYELVLLDRDPRGDPDVIAADLSRYDADWVRHFETADTVIHLAANPSTFAVWESLQRDNLDAVLNVFEAAVRCRLARVIFASTINVLEGYQDEPVPLTTFLPPKPLTSYATSKCLGERIGKSFSARHSLSVICLRIGTIPPDELRPQPHWRKWDQLGWLSAGDFCRGTEGAIDVENLDFAILNLVSDNVGGPFDVGETRRLLGYRPQDQWHSRPPRFALALKNSILRKKPGLLRWIRDR